MRYPTVNLGAVPRLGQDWWDYSGESPEGPEYTDESFTEDIGPSRPAASTSPAPASSSSSPGFFQQVGNFFSGLFTPSNIKTAAQLIQNNKSPSPAPAAIPAPAPAPASPVSGNTLLLVGGGTVALVVIVALATRS